MEKVKIIDFCNISNGFAFKSDKYISENGARVIRITNVQKGKIVDNDPKLYPFSELDKLEAYKIFEGDILMSLTGNVGRVGRFPKELLPAYINQRVCRVMPKNEKLDTNFLFHFLNSDVFENEAIKNSAGAAQLNLSTKWLGDFEIPLPNLATQQRIAAILDQADAIIQNNRAIVQKYDALTQSLFLDMFGDPVKNEKGWENKNLEKILKFLTSGSRGWAKYYSNAGDIFLRIQNIGYNKLRLDDLTFINTPNSAEAKRTKVEPGDIVISITADLGRTAVIPSDFPTAFINQHLAILRFSEESNPFYISAFIASKGGQTLFNKLDKGGVKSGLNFTDLKSYKLLLPPLELQNQFAERVAVIEAQKQQAQLELAKSEELFASLLQRAFKGELN